MEMTDLAGFILSIFVLIGMVLIWRNLNRQNRPRRQSAPKRPPPGKCVHTSSKKLKVTSMGDSEDYYLCKLCNKKVKARELYYFEKGGIQ